MAERIDNLKYDYANLKEQPFINSPGEFLARTISEQLKISEFKIMYGGSIDGYKRMDWSERELPAMRVYNDTQTKTGESWFIDGDIKIDSIMPASLRRNELQQVQDSLSAALLQQFRRTTFFNTMNTLVPGLNELGKIFAIDKSLGFEWGESIVPLTQITLNFRIDLRQWDNYLESQYRTKDDPFSVTLGDLKLMLNDIVGMNDDGTENVHI